MTFPTCQSQIWDTSYTQLPYPLTTFYLTSLTKPVKTYLITCYCLMWYPTHHYLLYLMNFTHTSIMNPSKPLQKLNKLIIHNSLPTDSWKYHRRSRMRQERRRDYCQGLRWHLALIAAQAEAILEHYIPLSIQVLSLYLWAEGVQYHFQYFFINWRPCIPSNCTMKQTSVLLSTWSCFVAHFEWIIPHKNAYLTPHKGSKILLVNWRLHIFQTVPQNKTTIQPDGLVFWHSMEELAAFNLKNVPLIGSLTRH